MELQAMEVYIRAAGRKKIDQFTESHVNSVDSTAFYRRSFQIINKVTFF